MRASLPFVAGATGPQINQRKFNMAGKTFAEQVADLKATRDSKTNEMNAFA